MTGFALDHRQVAPGNVFGAFRRRALQRRGFYRRGGRARRGRGRRAARGARSTGAAHLAAAEPRRPSPSSPRASSRLIPTPSSRSPAPTARPRRVEMTRQLWRMAGHRSASIGTLGVTTADEQVRTGLTSPDIVTFLSNMAGMRRMGISHVAYRSVEPRARPVSRRGRAGEGRRLHQFVARPPRLSRRHGQPISPPRCGCSTKSSPTMARRWCGPTIRARAEVIARATAARPAPADRRRSGRDDRARQPPLDPARPAAGAAPRRARASSSTLPLIGAYQAANVLVAAGLVLATGGDWATTLPAWGASRRCAGGSSAR